MITPDDLTYSSIENMLRLLRAHDYHFQNLINALDVQNGRGERGKEE
jgi:hypothetical protein